MEPTSKIEILEDIVKDEIERLREIKDINLIKPEFEVLAQLYNSRLEEGTIPYNLISNMRERIYGDRSFCNSLDVDYSKMTSKDINKINYFILRVSLRFPKNSSGLLDSLI